jgi:hypothetical protein
VWLSTSELVEARRSHERALELYEALADREGCIEARTALGLVESSRGAPELALALLRASVEDA